MNGDRVNLAGVAGPANDQPITNERNWTVEIERLEGRAELVCQWSRKSRQNSHLEKAEGESIRKRARLRGDASRSIGGEYPRFQALSLLSNEFGAKRRLGVSRHHPIGLREQSKRSF